MKEEKQDWILGEGGSSKDGVQMWIYKNKTPEEMKEIILKRCQTLQSYDPKCYDFGTQNKNEIEEKINNSLYGYVCFSDYHVDVQATPMKNIRIYK